MTVVGKTYVAKKWMNKKSGFILLVHRLRILQKWVAKKLLSPPK